MPAPLSSRAQRWLRSLQPKLYVGRQWCPLSASAQEVLSWCQAHDLLRPDQQGWAQQTQVAFDRDLLQRIESTQRELQQHPFSQPLSQLNRAQQAELAKQEVKSQGPQPRAQRLLINRATAHLPEGMPRPLDQFIDVDWQQLPLQAFKSLLVIENLDSFYRFPSMAQACWAQSALVVYRGDAFYGFAGSRAMRQQARQQGLVCRYLGDLDPMGLALAADFDQVLLPSLDWFMSQPGPYPERQWPYLARLQQQDSAPLRPYVQRLAQGFGLSQQHFEQIPLVALACRKVVL